MRIVPRSFAYNSVLSLTLLSFVQTAMAEVKPYPSCDRDPTESDISAAKGAYEAGHVSFQEGDYDRALLYWEDAFRRDCTAVKLLLNIARAYELDGNLEAAINSLQTYLDRRPDAKDRSSVETRIENFRRRMDAQKAEEERLAASDEGGDTEPENPPAAHLQPVDDTSKTKSPKPVWPLVLTGVGVVGAISGHTVAAIQQRKIEDRKDAIATEIGCDPETNECETDELRDAANDAVDNDSEVGKLRDKRDAANSLAGLGHLMGITGGVLWWILWTQHKSPDDSRASSYFQPIVAPNYQGLSFSGRF